MTGTHLPMTDDLRASLATLFSGEVGPLTSGMVTPPVQKLRAPGGILGPDMGTAKLPFGFVGSVHEFLPGSWGCVVLRNKEGDQSAPPPEYTSLPPVFDCPFCGNHATVLCRHHQQDSDGFRYWHLQVHCRDCLPNGGVENFWNRGYEPGRVLEVWVDSIRRWNRQVMGQVLLRRDLGDPELYTVFGKV